MPKISGTINNCGFNAAIPSVLKVFAQLDNPFFNTPYKQEYIKLKEMFCTFYNLNNKETTFTQLHQFITKSSGAGTEPRPFFEQELILGPVLRNYFIGNFQDGHKAKVVSILALGQSQGFDEETTRVIHNPILDEEQASPTLDDSGKFQGIDPLVLNWYLYSKLGIDLNFNSFNSVDGELVPDKITPVLFESLKEKVTQPVETMNLIHKGGHYELELQNFAISAHAKDGIASQLQAAISLQDKKNKVERILNDFKTKTASEFNAFQQQWTDKQTKFNDSFEKFVRDGYKITGEIRTQAIANLNQKTGLQWGPGLGDPHSFSTKIPTGINSETFKSQISALGIGFKPQINFKGGESIPTVFDPLEIFAMANGIFSPPSIDSKEKLQIAEILGAQTGFPWEVENGIVVCHTTLPINVRREEAEDKFKKIMEERGIQFVPEVESSTRGIEPDPKKANIEAKFEHPLQLRALNIQLDKFLCDTLIRKKDSLISLRVDETQSKSSPEATPIDWRYVCPTVEFGQSKSLSKWGFSDGTHGNYHISFEEDGSIKVFSKKPSFTELTGTERTDVMKKCCVELNLFKTSDVTFSKLHEFKMPPDSKIMQKAAARAVIIGNKTARENVAFGNARHGMVVYNEQDTRLTTFNKLVTDNQNGAFPFAVTTAYGLSLLTYIASDTSLNDETRKQLFHLYQSVSGDIPKDVRQDSDEFKIALAKGLKAETNEVSFFREDKDDTSAKVKAYTQVLLKGGERDIVEKSTDQSHKAGTPKREIPAFFPTNAVQNQTDQIVLQAGGCKTHSAIVCIWKKAYDENNQEIKETNPSKIHHYRVFRTVCNAGYGTITDENNSYLYPEYANFINGKSFSVCTQEVLLPPGVEYTHDKMKEEVEKLIQTERELNLNHDLPNTGSAGEVATKNKEDIEKYRKLNTSISLGPVQKEYSALTEPQTTGNCTARSIQEYLRWELMRSGVTVEDAARVVDNHWKFAAAHNTEQTLQVLPIYKLSSGDNYVESVEVLGHPIHIEIIARNNADQERKLIWKAGDKYEYFVRDADNTWAKVENPGRVHTEIIEAKDQILAKFEIQPNIFQTKQVVPPPPAQQQDETIEQLSLTSLQTFIANPTVPEFPGIYRPDTSNPENDNALALQIKNNSLACPKPTMISMQELLNPIQTSQPSDTIGYHLLEACDARVVPKFKCMNGSVRQVASQFNNGESQDRHKTPPSLFKWDRTQGPAEQRTSGGAAIARYAHSDSCNCFGNILHSDKAQKFRKLFDYRFGYLTPYAGKEEEGLAFLKNNLNQLALNVERVKIDDTDNSAIQILNAGLALGMYDDYNPQRNIQGKDCIKQMSELLLVAQYEAVANVAILEAKQNPDKRIPVSFTLVGGGVFGNDKGAVANAASKAIEKIQQSGVHNIDICMSIYKNSEIEDYKTIAKDNNLTSLQQILTKKALNQSDVSVATHLPYPEVIQDSIKKLREILGKDNISSEELSEALEHQEKITQAGITSGFEDKLQAELLKLTTKEKEEEETFKQSIIEQFQQTVNDFIEAQTKAIEALDNIDILAEYQIKFSPIEDAIQQLEQLASDEEFAKISTSLEGLTRKLTDKKDNLFNKSRTSFQMALIEITKNEEKRLKEIMSPGEILAEINIEDLTQQAKKDYLEASNKLDLPGNTFYQDIAEREIQELENGMKEILIEKQYQLFVERMHIHELNEVEISNTTTEPQINSKSVKDFKGELNALLQLANSFEKSTGKDAATIVSNLLSKIPDGFEKDKIDKFLELQHMLDGLETDESQASVKLVKLISDQELFIRVELPVNDLFSTKMIAKAFQECVKDSILYIDGSPPKTFISQPYEQLSQMNLEQLHAQVFGKMLAQLEKNTTQMIEEHESVKENIKQLLEEKKQQIETNYRSATSFEEKNKCLIEIAALGKQLRHPSTFIQTLEQEIKSKALGELDIEVLRNDLEQQKELNFKAIEKVFQDLLTKEASSIEKLNTQQEVESYKSTLKVQIDSITQPLIKKAAELDSLLQQRQDYQGELLSPQLESKIKEASEIFSTRIDIVLQQKKETIAEQTQQNFELAKTNFELDATTYLDALSKRSVDELQAGKRDKLPESMAYEEAYTVFTQCSQQLDNISPPIGNSYHNQASSKRDEISKEKLLVFQIKCQEEYQKAEAKFSEALKAFSTQLESNIKGCLSADELDQLKKTPDEAIQAFEDSAKKLNDVFYGRELNKLNLDYLSKAQDKIGSSTQTLLEQIQVSIDKQKSEISEKQASEGLETARQAITQTLSALSGTVKKVVAQLQEGFTDPKEISKTLTDLAQHIQTATETVAAAVSAIQKAQDARIDINAPNPIPIADLEQKLSEMKTRQADLQKKFDTLVAEQKNKLLDAQQALHQAVETWINENLNTITPSSMTTKTEIDGAIQSLPTTDAGVQSLKKEFDAVTQANPEAIEVGIPGDELVKIDEETQKIRNAIEAKTHELNQRLITLQQEAYAGLASVKEQLIQIQLGFPPKLTPIDIKKATEFDQAKATVDQLGNVTKTLIDAQKDSATAANQKVSDAGILDADLVNIEEEKSKITQAIDEKTQLLTVKKQSLEEHTTTNLQSVLSQVDALLTAITTINEKPAPKTATEIAQKIDELNSILPQIEAVNTKFADAIKLAKDNGLEDNDAETKLQTLNEKKLEITQKIQSLQKTLPLVQAANQRANDIIQQLSQAWEQLKAIYSNPKNHTYKALNHALRLYETFSNFQNPKDTDKDLINILDALKKTTSEQKQKLELALNEKTAAATQIFDEISQITKVFLSSFPGATEANKTKLVSEFQALIKKGKQFENQLLSDTFRELDKNILTPAIGALKLATPQNQNPNQSQSPQPKTSSGDTNPKSTIDATKQIQIHSMFKQSVLAGQGADIVAGINVEDVAATELRKGIKCTVPSTKHTFQLKIDEEKGAQAILTRQGAGLDTKAIEQQKPDVRKNICLDVINMIENVLSKGENLHLSSKDQYIQAFAKYYVEYLRSQDSPQLNIKSNDGTLKDGNLNQKAEFKNIVDEYHQKHPLASMPWVEEHLSNTTTKPLVSINSGLSHN